MFYVYRLLLSCNNLLDSWIIVCVSSETQYILLSTQLQADYQSAIMDVGTSDASNSQFLARLEKATKTSELFQRKAAEQESVNDQLRLENVVSRINCTIDWVLNKF